jgi:hypothetical protein
VREVEDTASARIKRLVCENGTMTSGVRFYGHFEKNIIIIIIIAIMLGGS